MAGAQKGRTVPRRPLRIAPASSERADGCIQGFILGTGAFTLGTEAGQEAHRRGAFNSFAVGLTILWTVIQALFGRAGNPWRKCTPTRIADRQTGRDLPHPGPGRADERFMTVATTRSEEHTSELKSLMRISYAVFCLKKKNKYTDHSTTDT